MRAGISIQGDLFSSLAIVSLKVEGALFSRAWLDQNISSCHLCIDSAPSWDDVGSISGS